MNNKKIKYMIIFIVTFFLIFSFINASVYAVSKGDVTGLVKPTEGGTGSTEIKKIIGGVLGGIKYATAAIAVIMLSVIGAKYMLSAPSDRADMKKAMVTYVIGAVIMFSASAVIQIVQSISKAVS